MKFLKLTNSKRVLSNVCYTRNFTYINNYDGITRNMSAVIYHEKGDVVGHFNYYMEIWHDNKILFVFKLILSPAENRYSKSLSLEYFDKCFDNFLESFQGKKVFQTYINGLCNAGERHRSINITE